MKRLIIILLFITNPVQAEKIEQLSWYNLQELLEDDKLTYKIIKSCVSLNSAVTELIKKEHQDLAKEFFKSANYLYPFGILVFFVSCYLLIFAVSIASFFLRIGTALDLCICAIPIISSPVYTLGSDLVQGVPEMVLLAVFWWSGRESNP